MVKTLSPCRVDENILAVLAFPLACELKHLFDISHAGYDVMKYQKLASYASVDRGFWVAGKLQMFSPGMVATPHIPW